MAQVQFQVHLHGPNEADDVENTIIALSGVAGVQVDLAAHTITVDYDPDYSEPSFIRDNIVCSGYPVAGAGT